MIAVGNERNKGGGKDVVAVDEDHFARKDDLEEVERQLGKKKITAETSKDWKLYTATNSRAP